eukprot:TRINITY_DN76187_c0_g1_i1.p1 TRINITY_DN76187_c0_g1~~TRINITY_DN76187_c0_g1_i1.p1  ORF type:complete len:147 (-),score=0.82 TRINITY_DN76187_c0_g1_i1:486-926(-)
MMVTCTIANTDPIETGRKRSNTATTTLVLTCSAMESSKPTARVQSGYRRNRKCHKLSAQRRQLGHSADMVERNERGAGCRPDIISLSMVPNSQTRPPTKRIQTNCNKLAEGRDAIMDRLIIRLSRVLWIVERHDCICKALVKRART